MKRVHYFNGQLLGPEDFRTEQEYHIKKRKLQNRRSIGAGVVSGLHVAIHSDGVPVSTGLAIDRQGNEIVVDNPQFLPFPANPSTDRIVISFSETLTDPIPVIDERGTQPSRIEEGFRINYATE